MQIKTLVAFIVCASSVVVAAPIPGELLGCFRHRDDDVDNPTCQRSNENVREWDPPVSARAWNPPVSARDWDPPVSVRAWDPPVSAREWDPPVTARAVQYDSRSK